MSRKQSTEERFWSKASIGNSDQCWPWRGATDKDGYGRFRLNKDKQVKAHIYAKVSQQWRDFWHGNYFAGGPTDGMFDEATIGGVQFCHTCDNPPCINPDHIFVGTALLNAQDRDEKGRGKDTLRSVRQSYFSFPREVSVEPEVDSREGPVEPEETIIIIIDELTKMTDEDWKKIDEILNADNSR